MAKTSHEYHKVHKGPQCPEAQKFPITVAIRQNRKQRMVNIAGINQATTETDKERNSGL